MLGVGPRAARDRRARGAGRLGSSTGSRRSWRGVRRASRSRTSSGRKAFRRISLTVDRRVLIPRPETELLVEVALSLARGAPGRGRRDRERGGRARAEGGAARPVGGRRRRQRRRGRGGAVERGRGSGSTSSSFRPTCSRGCRVRSTRCSSNLPYVAEGVRRCRPRSSCTSRRWRCSAGPTGMDLVRRLLTMVDGVPLVALEVGLAEAVASLVAGAGFSSVEILRDLAGHERVRRRPPVSDREAFERCIAVGGVVAVRSRHRVRARVRSRRPVRGRAAVSAQAAQPRQALGGDVLSPRAGVRGAARDRRADARARWRGCCRARSPCSCRIRRAGLRSRAGSDLGTLGRAGAGGSARWPGCAGRCSSRARTAPAAPIRGRSTRSRRCCGRRSTS